LLSQIAGAMAGAFTVYLFFRNHFNITETRRAQKRLAFAQLLQSEIREVICFRKLLGTFVLILAVLLITLPQLEYESLAGHKVGMGSLGALPVALCGFLPSA
jgi:glycerol uptake facilitator protein